jgi:hypothetical protein
MTRCLSFHRWHALKHGAGMRLDARECLRCGRFEVWAYSRFYRANRENFKPLIEADQ